ncbi:phage tail protein [Photorhabdus laumondii subsp. laumondii]|uniref:Phage tail protein n=1 Tax=Photorhabdus laumondii subsp. laumondii TaxID=141679 RepID=A0A6L9JS12_PHOLM|nr:MULTISPECIES: phage tail protein [Photorhabdus]AXG42670.1 phage tail protein [Photorhabdus laumondii subsp. laumondii]MCC8384738.1 phage tail protein [Photorhabdus laumondii]MCC8413475.1 phage tail protein [Photorhabdus laumondii]NDK96479.1 phage tail protein [Photorhabdus laumondii subsp. laumondii]NDL17948.1 phage tail protein [Photorhabdus laumondii subsp. laumondii]
MLKTKLMRDIITKHNPFFVQNPDRLEVYVTEGNLIATGTASPLFLYQYKLHVLALDYPASLDSLSIPVLEWARRHQPDLLFNPDQRTDGIKFDADILSDGTADILFVLRTTERVVVQTENGQLTTQHLDEPPYPSASPSKDPWGVLIDGDVQK